MDTLVICTFVIFLDFFYLLKTFYKSLAYEINLIFCWLMSFKAFKMKFELEKVNNKFILDLGKFQVSFLSKNLNFYLSHDLKMNFQSYNIRFKPYWIWLHMVQKPSEALQSTQKLIKFPVTARHTIIPSNLTYSKWGRVLTCIADLNWNIKEFIFCYSRCQLTLPKRLDFNESELLPETFIMSDQNALYGLAKDDEYIICPTHDSTNFYMIFTAYKQVGKKIHPVSTQFPIDCQVTHQIPEDPLLTLFPLLIQPLEFTPTTKISMKWLAECNINAIGFLWPKEKKLFQHMMKINKTGIAFKDIKRGTLKKSYFSFYIIPTILDLP